MLFLKNITMSRRITPRRGKVDARRNLKVIGNHEEFLSRINKTLYYGKLPTTERFSLPVSELAAELFSEEKYGRSLDRLRLEEAASMSRNACVSPCSLVLALVYLERLKISNVDYVRQVPPSELFLVTMMVASKFLYDDGEEDEVLNDEWAASAGIDVKEMNRFERDFLQAINWEVYVSEQNFWKRLWTLEKQVALREGKERGWFSYTDMERLLDSVDVIGLVNAVLTVSTVCLTSYTVSVLALLGSAFIVSQIPGNAISQTTHKPSLSTAELPQSIIPRNEENNIDELMASLTSVPFDSTTNISVIDTQNSNVYETTLNLPDFLIGGLEHKVNSCHSPVISERFVEKVNLKFVDSVIYWIWEHMLLKMSRQNHDKLDVVTAPRNYTTLNWLTLIAPWSLHVPYLMKDVSSVNIISQWH